MVFEQFPSTRLRRNRSNQAIRDLLAETQLLPSNLILPLFVVDGDNQQQQIPALPDCFRFSIDLAVKQAKIAYNLGIKAMMLFPVIDPALKCPTAKEAHNTNNLMCRAITQIKTALPQMLIITDIALDPYTSHGHDGVVNQSGEVLNDETNEILCLQSLVYARAGSDFLAPSDMMDGRIGKIRQFLDSNSQQQVGLIAYSAKYASNFYGPFRHAVGSINNLKQADKKSYQLNYCNSKEAMREIALDISEGADSIIVKPAISYLDIIKDASRNFTAPVFAYQVSGEYAMLKLLANHCQANFSDLCLEQLIAIKRAGAQAIISYAAIDIAKFLQ